MHRRLTNSKVTEGAFKVSGLTGVLAAILAVAVMAIMPGNRAAAQETQSEKNLGLELNKLEPQDKNCRAYLVVTNEGDTVYEAFKLDLVMFGPDGVIGKRFALDLAPIKADKKTVKLFDLDNVACDQVGSFLINDVMECKAGATDSDDCLAHLSLSSKGEVKITK